METETKKARVALVVLVHLAALGLLFLVFADNPGHYVGVFASPAFAQSSDPVPSVRVPVGTAIYVNFEGVDGESEDIDHEGWINLLSFKQGQYTPASSVGSGAARASSVFEEIALRKGLDKSSPLLAAAVAQGKVFAKVSIHVTRALPDGTRVTYYSYELKNAVVTSYRVRGSTKDDVPIEDISLNFEQIKVMYMKYDNSGGYESIVEYGWDVVNNQPW